MDLDVVPGVHRVELAHVNCYLLVDADGVTVVDAGLPAVWHPLRRALDAIGARTADVRALVLTHAHFDHVGAAERLARSFGVPVLAHPGDHALARSPYRYAHERPRSAYPLRSPRAVPILVDMVRAGALHVPGVRQLQPIADGLELDLPGGPRVIATPGHTFGHCALHLPQADAVLTGDALVTLDPYTAGVGPRIVAGTATADSALALRSLSAIAATRATTLLPGHGEPWRGRAEDAVAIARRVGPS
ncbi:MBL fold metallo-hydrolase [Schumannella soli]|uniref:MBL fold metallo-hydrolase n=1 Tax=Schumannella soli TaxID=2590779 RepID=A0A506Y651_9MICO|nr:MBL fold metallo-hydrolase [Schumannella soli]TPW78156.1 MBL fold metallo-hydrolase [Schumannella soli]